LLLPFLEHILIHLNVQRLQKTAVSRCNQGGTGFATRQTDRGIQFQHNVIARGTDSRDGFVDALGLRNRIVNGVTQLAKQTLQLVVKLQGGVPPLLYLSELYALERAETSLVSPGCD